MNPDDYIEGTFDKNNPSNKEELPEEVFESNSLEACLDFFKVTGDSEPLENAIAYHELVKQKVTEDLTEVIILLRKNGMHEISNFLCKSREKLK